MSWKTFSLRKKPSNPNLLGAKERGKSLKRGDDKRIMLMTMVKEGKMSVENAMQKAYGMGIASVPYEEMTETAPSIAPNPSGEIYNFGVYRYSRNHKTIKCILHIDCQENSLSFIQHGQKHKSYSFLSVRNVDTVEDTTSLFIQFDDATEIEIDAGTYEDKNRIARVLRNILDQIHLGMPVADAIVQRTTLKEGYLEKKGRSAAFLMWTRRFVRICDREIMYFRPGEENNESSALSIITLKNDTFVKKIDSNGFLLITDQKEYTFRVPSSTQQETSEKERDDWILAIQDASKPRTLSDVSEDLSKTPMEQEQYLKGVVRSLNEELEQLGVMLNIIDAPIRASTQVKKVREIVHSLNDEITTGMLSWTLREASKKQSTKGGNESYLPSNDYYNQRYYPNSNKTDQSSISLHDYYNQQHFQTAEEPHDPKFHDYYNYPGETVYESESQNYSHLDHDMRPKQQQYHQESSYNMLNLSQMQPLTTKSLDRGISTSLPLRNVYSDDLTLIQEDDYATVNKAKTIDSATYYNLEHNYFEEGHSAPELPPRLDDVPVIAPESEKIAEKTNRTDIYSEHSFKTKSVENTDVNQGLEINASSEIPSVNAEVSNGSVPAPPAPPPLPGLNLIPQKEDKIPNCKMKPLFWTKVPDMQVSSSIFKDMNDKLDDFNVDRLEKLFCLSEQIKTVKPPSEVDGVTGNPKAVKKSLLNPRKAQNFGIFLSGFKLKSDDIEEKLSILDDEVGLSSEQITSLKRFQPTAEEIEMYKSFKGNAADLPNVDQFMLSLSKIPQLGSRLDALLVVRELPDNFKAIQKPISNLLSACRDLSQNANFPRLIEYVLSVGNYLNGGTPRGRAHGFKVGALVKLVDIRSSDKKHTLLQYIAEELYEKDPDVLFCYKDIPALLLPVDVSIKGLVAEVEIMRKELQNVEKNIKSSPASSNVTFYQDIQAFIKDYLEKIEQLESECKEINELSNVLKRTYGEQQSSDFQVWLDHVSTFMKQLQRAAEDIKQKKQRLSRTHSSITEHDLNPNKTTVKVEKEETTKMPEVEKTTTANVDQSYDEITSHSTIIDTGSSDYEQIVIQPSKSLPRKQTNEESSLTRAPTKVYTLKQATVIESNHHSDFDSSDDELSFPTKSGFLEKLSGGKRQKPKWDKRYFEVTTSGYLLYSKKKDSKLSGSVYLRGLSLLLDSNDSKLLKMQGTEREWHLKAENELELLDWYNVIIYYAHMEEIANI